MTLTLTYVCPSCGRKTKRNHVVAARHENCTKPKPGKKPPFWILKKIEVDQ